MGCCCPRKITVEKSVMSGEYVLGFWTCEVSTAISMLKELAEGECISKLDLDKYSSRL